MELSVNSTTIISFNIWRSAAADRLSAQQFNDFTEALQETKYKITAQNDKLSQEEIKEEPFKAVIKCPVRDVIGLGLSRNFQTLREEKAERLRSMQANARTETRPDDVRSQRYHSDLHDA